MFSFQNFILKLKYFFWNGIILILIYMKFLCNWEQAFDNILLIDCKHVQSLAGEFFIQGLLFLFIKIAIYVISITLWFVLKFNVFILFYFSFFSWSFHCEWTA